jgi:protein phosphatase
MLLAGGLAGWRWSQQQYFVGVDGGTVAVYQGLTQDIGPLSTSHVLETTDIALTDLPTYWSDRVEARISARDLTGAHDTVQNLEDLAAACRAATAAPTSPTGTATAAPTATSTPTATTSGTPTGTPSPSETVTVEDCGGAG